MKVSVIMPVWNPNEWLEEAIDSILNQEFKDFEIILVDDCSDDSSYLSWVKNKDKRIKIFKHDKNKNQASAMNTGLKHAKGKYICFLDYDDKYTPDKLSKQLKYLDTHKVDMVYSDGWYIDEKGEVTKDFMLIDDPSNILKFNHIACLSVLIIKSVFDKIGYFDENLQRSHDWDMWIRVYKAGYKIVKMKEQLHYYRIHPNQKSTLTPAGKAHTYIRRKHNLK